MSPQRIVERSPEVIRQLADPALRAILLAMAVALACESLGPNKGNSEGGKGNLGASRAASRGRLRARSRKS